MEAGPVDQPNIGQEAPRVRAPDIEVFLLSAYYQKSQNRRNPLKAKFRVVRVCKIPHPYKDRIDRLVAQVEGPNAVLGNPATYRGQVLRLLCNLLFPLEASYISDQLLSYRVLRSISSANLPLLVRMGLSTEVTLARNQRGQLCQYIKVFFLSELIYQRRIRCKEDKIAELVPYEEYCKSKGLSPSTCNFVVETNRRLKCLVPTMRIGNLPDDQGWLHYQAEEYDLDNFIKFRYPFQLKEDFLIKMINRPTDPQGTPADKMPVVIETEVGPGSDQQSPESSKRGEAPILGDDGKRYATASLFQNSQFTMLQTCSMSSGLQGCRKAGPLYGNSSWYRYADPKEVSEYPSLADVLNQINAKSAGSLGNDHLMENFMGAVGFFELLMEATCNFVRTSSLKTSSGVPEIRLDWSQLQQLFKLLPNAADCLDQYITHFFSFRDRVRYPYSDEFQDMSVVVELQAHLRSVVQLMMRPAGEFSDLNKLLEIFEFLHSPELRVKLNYIAIVKVIWDQSAPPIPALKLIDSSQTSKPVESHTELQTPTNALKPVYGMFMEAIGRNIPEVTAALLRSAFTSFNPGTRKSQLDLIQQYSVDLKGRPLGIWNHKTKNLIRYKDQLVQLGSQKLVQELLASEESLQLLPKPKCIKKYTYPQKALLNYTPKKFLGMFRSFAIAIMDNPYGHNRIVAISNKFAYSERWKESCSEIVVEKVYIYRNSVSLLRDTLCFIEKERPLSQGKICILKLSDSDSTISTERIVNSQVSFTYPKPSTGDCYTYDPRLQLFARGPVDAVPMLVLVAKQQSDKKHKCFFRYVSLYRLTGSTLEFLDGFQDTYYKTGSRTIFFEKNRVPFVLEFNFHSSVLHGVSKDNKLVKVSDNPLKKIPLLDWPNKQWTIRYHLKDAVGLPQKTDSSGLLHIAIRGSQLDGQSSLRIYSVKLQM